MMFRILISALLILATLGFALPSSGEEALLGDRTARFHRKELLGKWDVDILRVEFHRGTSLSNFHFASVKIPLGRQETRKGL